MTIGESSGNALPPEIDLNRMNDAAGRTRRIPQRGTYIRDKSKRLITFSKRKAGMFSMYLSCSILDFLSGMISSDAFDS
jgi:hypothetical protein